MSDRHQEIMNAAYDRWQKNSWSKQRFWDDLSAAERFAVFTGNFNQQVTNGGFYQWHSNGYGSPEVLRYLIDRTKEMGTPTALKVHDLLKKYKKVVANVGEEGGYGDNDPLYDALNAEDLDGIYYTMDADFLAECEAYINMTWPAPDKVIA